MLFRQLLYRPQGYEGAKKNNEKLVACQKNQSWCWDLNLGIVSYKYSRITLIRALVFRIATYSDRLCPSGKFGENSIKLICIEITGYRIKYSTLLWLIELQIRLGRMIQRQVYTVNSNSRTANCQCSPFSKKNPIIWMARLSNSSG